MGSNSGTYADGNASQRMSWPGLLYSSVSVVFIRFSPRKKVFCFVLASLGLRDRFEPWLPQKSGGGGRLVAGIVFARPFCYALGCRLSRRGSRWGIGRGLRGCPPPPHTTAWLDRNWAGVGRGHGPMTWRSVTFPPAAGGCWGWGRLPGRVSHTLW